MSGRLALYKFACPALVACICTAFVSQASAQLTAQQKAIYDAGYAAGFEAGKKSLVVNPSSPGTPGTTTTLPILAAPRTVTHIGQPYYFLVQQQKGLGAFEFSKNPQSGEITIRDVDPESFANLLATGKLTSPNAADKTLAMKDYSGLYQEKLKSLGATGLPVAVVPK